MFMLYDKNLRKAMLNILDKRVLGIANSINTLADKGFTPNKNKITVLDWATILIHAYENVDVFSKEQQNNLDKLYNRVITL